ncbi:prepilin-type N-terminal cleavage/methylation domain-containing protein [Anthocerotibacter panamensis]|uniref:prepilin-type N-terminal cleavage/methylation domain-containing protein n=1 Tax=Anthocerotibacter panamensis TaxID=2857077 RepID=UPI001C407515|nr:prepilin-type N-terminal cleavage/methylation domain-containing protein [Anthocerotibacter panamensis]
MARRTAQGLTLIEVLVSAVIASLLLSSLASFFAVSAVKRLQSAHIYEATQLARSEINEIREFWQQYDEKGEAYFDRQALVFAWSDEYFDTVPETNNGPTFEALTDPSAIPPNAKQIPEQLRVIPVDTNGDGQADYLAQVFAGQAPGVPKGELRRVVVRIFDRDVAVEELQETPVRALRPLVYGSSQAANEQSLSQPLVVLVADLSRPEVPL